MSSVTHQMVSFWDALPQATVHAGTLAAGEFIPKGTLAFSVDGKVYSPDSVLNSSGALYLVVPGADANGGIMVWSRQQNVRYVQVAAIGDNTLAVDVTYNNVLHTIDVAVTLGTTMGVATTLAHQVVSALLAHGEASQLLRFFYTGTGNGVTAGMAGYTAVPQVTLLGVAQNNYDNSLSMTDLTDEFRFTQGVCRLASLPTNPVTPAMIGGSVAIADNITVKATPTSIDYKVKLIDVATSGAIFVDIQE